MEPIIRSMALHSRRNGAHSIRFFGTTFLARSLVAMILISACFMAHARTIQVLTYHNFPPFVVNAEQQQGLSFDVVTLLNALKIPGTQFKLVIHPRSRLNRELRRQPEWLVLWTNPVWFKDGDMTHYAWTAPIFEDANVLVTRDPAFDYAGPMSLQHMHMVGLREHRYEGVSEMIDSGFISRENAPGWDSLLPMIAYRPHVDFAIMPMLAARYYRIQLKLQDKVYIAPTPHSRYTRSIMGSPSSAVLEDLIENLAGQLSVSPQWKALVRKYQLEDIYIDDPAHYSGKSWYFSLDPKDRTEH